MTKQPEGPMVPLRPRCSIVITSCDDENQLKTFASKHNSGRRNSAVIKPAVDEIDEEHCHFKALEASTVPTTRQFGLLRGKSIRQALDVLHAENDRRRRASVDSGLSNSPPATPDPVALAHLNLEAVEVPQRRHSRSGSASYVQVAEKPVNYKWFWPLGSAKVSNGEERFEARLPTMPFRQEEVWATVMGNDLTVMCDATGEREEADGSAEKSSRRFVLRTYKLPLNVQPLSSEFGYVQRTKLRVTTNKEQAIKLAVASVNGDN